MNFKRIAASSIVAAALGTAWAAPTASASTTISCSPSDGCAKTVVVGDELSGPADWHQQHYGDCAELASEVVIHEETGVELSAARIDAYAQKSGAMPDGLWGGTYITSIPALLGHYGVKATLGSHSISTVETDLQAGDRVIAYVDAGMIWNSELPVLARYGYGAQGDDGTADHVLVVDAINITNSTVTLTDSGGPWGASEVVSLSVFKAAWATGGYLTVVATS